MPDLSSESAVSDFERRRAKRANKVRGHGEITRELADQLKPSGFRSAGAERASQFGAMIASR